MSGVTRKSDAEPQRRFMPYPEYKDSGVEWLGEIPEHWEVKRLKHLAALNPEALSEDTDPAFEMDYVDIGGVDSLGRIIERDQLESDDRFMRHLSQIVRNGLGDRAGTCIDPECQVVQGRTVCVVSCQRSPEPVFLEWKGMEATAEGDFFVRSGPGTVKLPPDSAREYIRTRFGTAAVEQKSETPA